MSKLVIDYVVPDLPLGNVFRWHKTGMPPLGISLLKAMTPPEIDGYEIVTRCHHERTMGAYDPAVQRPDILAVSVITPAATRAFTLLMACRAITSWQGRRIRTLAGGAHVSALPVEALHYADGVIRGDTPPALLDSVLHWALRQIEEDGNERRVFEYHPDLHAESLPRRPHADHSWYPRRRYLTPNVLLTSVGCPFDCPFCSVTYTYGNRHRHVEYRDLASDIAALPTDGITLVIDDNFIPSGKLDHVRHVCSLLRQHGSRWCAEVSSLTMQHHGRELLPLLSRSGCELLYLGIESIDGGLAKSIDPHVYQDLISAMHDCGIAVVGLIMFGVHAQETPDIFERTAAWARVIKLDVVNLGINTPMPGARNFEQAVRQGQITNWRWEHYDTWYPVSRHPGISAEAMFTGIRDCYRWFYGWPSIRERILARAGSAITGSPGEFRLKHCRSLAMMTLANLALGTNRMMSWRQGESFAEYQRSADTSANPFVMAQFGPDKPISQYDAKLRMRELLGEMPNRTPDIIGYDVPLTVLRDNMEVICAYS